MHMTPKNFSGMSQQTVTRLLSKVIILALSLVLVSSAVSVSTNQTHVNDKETWEQRVRKLMHINLEEIGGAKKSSGRQAGKVPG